MMSVYAPSVAQPVLSPRPCAGVCGSASSLLSEKHKRNGGSRHAPEINPGLAGMTH